MTNYVQGTPLGPPPSYSECVGLAHIVTAELPLEVSAQYFEEMLFSLICVQVCEREVVCVFVQWLCAHLLSVSSAKIYDPWHDELSPCSIEDFSITEWRYLSNSNSSVVLRNNVFFMVNYNFSSQFASRANSYKVGLIVFIMTVSHYFIMTVHHFVV